MCEAEAGAQLMCEAEAGPNVAQFLNEIKHETVDDDLENLDPGFLQVRNPPTTTRIIFELRQPTWLGNLKDSAFFRKSFRNNSGKRPEKTGNFSGKKAEYF